MPISVDNNLTSLYVRIGSHELSATFEAIKWPENVVTSHSPIHFTNELGDLQINHHFHHSRVTFLKLFSAHAVKPHFLLLGLTPNFPSVMRSVPANRLLRAAR